MSSFTRCRTSFRSLDDARSQTAPTISHLVQASGFVVDVVLDNRPSSPEVLLRNGQSDGGAARRVVRRNHSDGLILKLTLDTFAVQQAFEQVHLDDGSGVHYDPFHEPFHAGYFPT